MAHLDFFSLILDKNTINEYRKFEVVEKSNDKQLCFECLLPVERIRRCGKCLHAVYCGKECQTRAWKTSGHKISCGIVKVIEIEGKGCGVVACKDINEGDIVMMERPLINISPSLNKRTEINDTMLLLDDSVKRKLMSLDSNGVTGDSKLPRIITINNFTGKLQNQIVYYMISRLNHSCVPNIRVDVQSTDPNIMFTPVVALKNIQEGEELTFNYLVESGKYLTRNERQSKLSQFYSVRCQCKACSLNGNKLIKSDKNRRQLKEVEQELGTTSNIEKVGYLVEKKRQLLDAEGLDTINNLMMLTKDLLLASRSSRDIKKYQEEGRRYAERLHDQEMIEYFSKSDSERMMEMMFFG